MYTIDWQAVRANRVRAQMKKKSRKKIRVMSTYDPNVSDFNESFTAVKENLDIAILGYVKKQEEQK